MLELKGRQIAKTVPIEHGLTLLDHALKHDVDIGFSCLRGTCGRCRCLVEEGAAHLEEVTDAEWDRLDEEELEMGYRLGCQASVHDDGPIRVVYKPYF
jgi:ferredoxin, 2Fe-2S